MRDFAVDNPHVTVSLLRFSNVLGPDIVTPLSKALRLPLVPSVFGFDPRFQFVHEDDVVRSMLFVVGNGLPGIFNVAGDGLLPWSEVARICGKRTVAMPFVGAGLAAGRPAAPRRRPARPSSSSCSSTAAASTTAASRRPASSTGSPRPARCRPTSRRCASRATVGPDPEYQYQEEVENFFRHSPAIVRDRPVGDRREPRPLRGGRPGRHHHARRPRPAQRARPSTWSTRSSTVGRRARGRRRRRRGRRHRRAAGVLRRRRPLPPRVARSRTGLRHIYEGFLRVARCTLPTIAAVNGAAVGAGMNLALACDLRLAARRAKFDTRFLQLGIHPGGGHTWMLQRIAGPQAAAAAVLFGEVLDGEAAERCRPGVALRRRRRAAGRRRRAGRPGRRRAPRAGPPGQGDARPRCRGVATHDEAVDVELEAQVWSLGQPEFAERLKALQQKISSR